MKSFTIKNDRNNDVASSSGLFGMEIQGAVTIFAVNEANNQAYGIK